MASTGTNTAATAAAAPAEHRGVVGTVLHGAKEALKVAPQVVKGGAHVAGQGVEAGAHVARSGVQAGAGVVGSGVHYVGEHATEHYRTDGHTHKAGMAEKVSHLAEKTVEHGGNFTSKYVVGAGEKVAKGSVKATEKSTNATLTTAKHGVGAAEFVHGIGKHDSTSAAGTEPAASTSAPISKV